MRSPLFQRFRLALDIRHALSASAPESLEELREMLASLEAQLVTLYEEKEEWSTSSNTPDESLTALYEDKQRLSARTVADLRASVDSFSAQLAEFYEEREQHGAAAGVGSSAELLVSLQSFEAQLHALYDERAREPFGHGEAVEMVHSLEAQVVALLDERNDLAEQIARASHDVSNAKRRARELVNAVVDQSFA